MSKINGISSINNMEYMEYGVSISPSMPESGSTTKIMYDGLLAKSGASHIYAHVGYGTNWNNPQYYKMSKTSTGFEATVPVADSDTFNVCFKDCANNWDNNSGKNYSFDISR